MKGPIPVDEDVSFGGQPTPAELRGLTDRGVRCVINLRCDEEPAAPLSPLAEGEDARRLGLDYHHLPVSVREADAGTIDWFRRLLSDAPRPTYVHCRNAERAGAFVLADRGTERGWSGEETLAEARRLGLACASDQLSRLVRDYVDEHRVLGSI